LFIRGLKSNILLTQFFLLALAMLLIGVVLVSMAKKELIRSEADKGRIVLQGITHRLHPIIRLDQLPPSFSLIENLNRDEKKLFSCITALHWSDNTKNINIDQCGLSSSLSGMVSESLEYGKNLTQFNETSASIFAKGSGYLLLSQAIFENGETVGAIAVAIDLKDVFKKIEKIRNIFLVYFLANIIILVLLGFFLLYRSMIRPIQKMVDFIEGFRDTEDFLLPDRKNDTEFQKLNKSLQRMVRRFSRNREELRSTVDSLEEANQNLQQAQAEIVRAEKLASVGRLSAGIAHEIGNPIGIVLGYFELLKQGGLSEVDQKDFLSRAEDEINRINVIIRQLLDLSRSSSEGLQSTSVHAILNDLSQVISVQPLMAQVQFDLHLNAEKNLVLADAGQLRQVFLNLIINASDALATKKDVANGKLQVSTSLDEEYEGETTRLQISFIDNGPGIPSDVLETIFDPFFTTKEPGKGTGLGLAVSFMIIESFGGSIDVDSVQGEGTTMVISLPVSSEDVTH